MMKISSDYHLQGYRRQQDRGVGRIDWPLQDIIEEGYPTLRPSCGSQNFL